VGRESDGDADHLTSRPLGHSQSQAGKSSPRGIRIDGQLVAVILLKKKKTGRRRVTGRDPVRCQRQLPLQN
jgi:hypothetical protein